MELAAFDKCTGCEACVQICPKSAISLALKKDGFTFPAIDKEKCIQCKLCTKTCPVLNPIKADETFNGTVYAAKTLDEDIRKKSSSGGIFYILAKEIIAKNGVVFGAEFADDFSVRHNYADTLKGVSKFQTSKYVQSSIGKSYKECRDFLLKDRYVLFSGTSCQIDGLLHFLGKKFEKLYTVDLICSGNTSPAVWTDYLNFQERKYKSKVKTINFRDKTYSWNMYCLSFKFLNDRQYKRILTNDSWGQLFLHHQIQREVCFNCMYKSYKHAADFTLGDFWGVNFEYPELFDNKGLSFVLCHNKKAQDFFNNINQLQVREIPKEVVEKRNVAIIKSPVRPLNREQFWKDYYSMPFKKNLKKYCHVAFWKRSNILYVNYWDLRLFLGRLIRKILGKD